MIPATRVPGDGIGPEITHAVTSVLDSSLDTAAALRKAIDAALNADKVRTRDLGGTASTSDFASAVINRVNGRG